MIIKDKKDSLLISLISSDLEDHRLFLTQGQVQCSKYQSFYAKRSNYLALLLSLIVPRIKITRTRESFVFAKLNKLLDRVPWHVTCSTTRYISYICRGGVILSIKRGHSRFFFHESFRASLVFREMLDLSSCPI